MGKLPSLLGYHAVARFVKGRRTSTSTGIKTSNSWPHHGSRLTDRQILDVHEARQYQIVTLRIKGHEQKWNKHVAIVGFCCVYYSSQVQFASINRRLFNLDLDVQPLPSDSHLCHMFPPDNDRSAPTVFFPMSCFTRSCLDPVLTIFL